MLVLRGSLAAATMLVCLPVEASGLDATAFRLALGPGGVGTVEGAEAPAGGALALSLGADHAYRPVVLEQQDGATRGVLDARSGLEPSVGLGVGAGFALFGRAPFVLHDAIAPSATQRRGVALESAGGLRSPSGGVLVPLVRFRGGAKLAARGEVMLPLGAPEALRAEATVAGRAGLSLSGRLGPANTALDVGAELRPVAEVGGVRRGGAGRVAAGLRVPLAPRVAALGFVDTRVDVMVHPTPSALLGAGVAVQSPGPLVELVAAAGVGEALATPRWWLGLKVSGEVLLRVPSGGGRSVEPGPPEPPRLAAPAVAAGSREPVPAPSPERVVLVASPVRPLALVLPPVLFATGSDDLDADAMRGLARLAIKLRAFPTRLHVVGHADRRGSNVANDALGMRRALAVVGFLVELGVPSGTLLPTTRGARAPARGAERSDDDEQRDRRVELVEAVDGEGEAVSFAKWK